MSISSDLGSNDSHDFKRKRIQGTLDLFTISNYKCVADILLDKVDDKYLCTEQFRMQLADAIKGKPYESLHGFRLIDHRGGNSIHSWELGTKGKCTDIEKEFLNLLIENRRKKEFGTHQDGKSLTIPQIKTFTNEDNLEKLLEGLVRKGYLRKDEGEKYNLTCGNMSFEVFKFLDPQSISITIVTSDAHRLGVVHNGLPRRITPRECARLQGFPDSFTLHPNDKWAYKQIGNSVSVPVITAIFSDLQANGCSVFNDDLHAYDRKQK
jgi:DNA (cytosine-5)-methyltransferase 1